MIQLPFSLVVITINKREKETIQLQLEAEEDVLHELGKQYEAALAQINEKIKLLQADELTQSKAYQLQYQQALKGQIEGILEKLHGDEYSTIQGYLSEAYKDGYIGTMYSIAGQGIPLIMPIDQKAAVKAILTDSKISKGLYTSLGVDTSKLKKSIRQEITRGIATGQSYTDIARNVANVSKAPLSRAKTIVRTEGHRIQQASTMDAQEAAKKKGCDVVKQWDSTLDGKTRDTHRELDGQIREIDELFEANGKEAKAPGYFGDPAEDCNCRCVSLTRARWALDEAELKTLQDRAAFFGLDKTKDFKDFKKKYLKADAEINDGLVKAGKVEANGRFVHNQEKLYRYSENIKPIDGYEDFTCHATADWFYIDTKGKGNEEDFVTLLPTEYAEIIRNSNTYHGGDVRIISCQAGAKDGGAAQKLANALNVAVMAPTETVNIDENGEMFISDNDILAEMWYHADKEERAKFKETGTWIVFEPRKE